MKQIFLTVLLLNSFASYCQFIKGDKYLGGTIYLNTQRAPDSQNGGLTNLVNSFSISPSVGFLLNEKFAVGGQIGYSSYYSKSTNFAPYVSESKSSSIGIGFFARRFYKISDRFLFSIIGLINFNRGSNANTQTNTSANTVTESETQNYQLSTSIRPAFVFFPSPKWGFEASVGNISYSIDRNLSNDEKSNFFNINYGTISLGLSYYFRKSDQSK